MFIAFTDINSTTKTADVIHVDPEKVEAVLTASNIEPGLDDPKLGLLMSAGKVIWIVGNMDTVLSKIDEGKITASRARCTALFDAYFPSVVKAAQPAAAPVNDVAAS